MSTMRSAALPSSGVRQSDAQFEVRLLTPSRADVDTTLLQSRRAGRNYTVHAAQTRQLNPLAPFVTIRVQL